MTHHLVPNCAKCRRDREAVHIFHTSSSHSAPFLQKQCEAAASLYFLFDFLQRLALTSLVRYIRGTPRSVDAFNHLFPTRVHVCVLSVEESMAVPSLCFAHTPNFFVLI